MIQPPRTVMHAMRILRGVTQSELAASMGVPQSAISLLETGAKQPDPDLAYAAAVALDVPIALLGAPAPAPRIGHTVQASLRRTAVNQMLATVTMTHVHLELLLGSRTADIERDSGASSFAHPHDLAERVRRHWGMPAGPVHGLVPLVEGRGVVCIYRDLRPLRIHALASTAESGQTVLLLDMRAARTEVAWAIAHELGHLVFSAAPSKSAEDSADAFAAAFLVPGREAFDDGSLRHGLDLQAQAATWGVQPRMLVNRMRDLRVVTARRFRELIHETQSVVAREGRSSLLGSPAAVANVVRDQGGSARAASRALLTTEELRTTYLARSGR